MTTNTRTGYSIIDEILESIAPGGDAEEEVDLVECDACGNRVPREETVTAIYPSAGEATACAACQRRRTMIDSQLLRQQIQAALAHDSNERKFCPSCEVELTEVDQTARECTNCGESLNSNGDNNR